MRSELEIICFTSDLGNWLLKGFSHQWKKYAPDIDLKVVGFSSPEFEIPFDFISLGRFEDYPKTKWSDALILYLSEHCQADNVLIMLEDYWLMRPFRKKDLSDLMTFVSRKNPFRLDITTDRINSGGLIEDAGRIGDIEFFKCSYASYQLSFQASIYSKNQLLSILTPGETPWQVELEGTRRLFLRPDLEVYGTRQWIMVYQIMVDKGQFKRNGDWMFPARQLSDADYSELLSVGCMETLQ